MWRDYLKESQQIDSIVGRYSFLTYQILDNVCVIHDFYIRPEYRKLYRGTKEALTIANRIKQIAVENGCDWIGSEIYKANPQHDYIVDLDCHWGLEKAEETPYKTVLQMKLEKKYADDKIPSNG